MKFDKKTDPHVPPPPRYVITCAAGPGLSLSRTARPRSAIKSFKIIAAAVLSLAAFVSCENWIASITYPLFEERAETRTGGGGKTGNAIPVEKYDTADDTVFAAVTGISGVAERATAGSVNILSGTVEPAGATNGAVVWTVTNGGGTGAAIIRNELRAEFAGQITVTAVIADGRAPGTDYTQDIIISLDNRKTLTLNGVAVPMRYVPAGSFQRDGTAANVSVITNGYWLAETETTQELFQAVMGSNPSYFHGGSGREPTPGETQDQRPVEMVNWYHAIAFCNKLSIADGKEPVYRVNGISDWASLAYDQIPTVDNSGWNAATMDESRNGYRLPTEMEWMWAAIGADKTAQPNTTGYTKAFAGSSGSNSIGDYAWYGDNADSKTHEVGKKSANELGLKDMSGNLWEWCWDWFEAAYPAGELTGFTGAASGSNRVRRGGSWDATAYSGTAAIRIGSLPTAQVGNVGFRFACP